MNEKLYMKKYYQDHRAELREKQNFYAKSYRKTSAFKESQRKYRLKSKEKKNARQRIWRINNREKYLEYARKASRTLKGKLRDKAQHHNRRLREKGLRLAIIQQVYEENVKRFGTLTCELCFKPVDFGKDHLEHFMPLSRGGTNERINLGVAHGLCNRRKGNRTLEEHKAWL